MTASPTAAQQLPTPPAGTYATRIADYTRPSERWRASPNCMHMTAEGQRWCPCCVDERGRV